MRIYKFRAYWKEAKIMAKVEVLRLDGSIEFFVPVKSGEKTWDELQVLDEREQYELMQWTGLLDRNGKEIYEGDIIELDGQNWKIYWNELDAGFCYQPLIPRSCSINMCYLYQRAVVIGNIYENPELSVPTPSK